MKGLQTKSGIVYCGCPPAYLKKACQAIHPEAYICTRPRYHAGPHHAHEDDGVLFLAWEAESFKRQGNYRWPPNN